MVLSQLHPSWYTSHSLLLQRDRGGGGGNLSSLSDLPMAWGFLNRWEQIPSAVSFLTPLLQSSTNKWAEGPAHHLPHQPGKILSCPKESPFEFLASSHRLLKVTVADWHMSSLEHRGRARIPCNIWTFGFGSSQTQEWREEDFSATKCNQN